MHAKPSDIRLMRTLCEQWNPELPPQQLVREFLEQHPELECPHPQGGTVIFPRLQGVDDIREVKLAMVETDGVVSVIRQEWAEKTKGITYRWLVPDGPPRTFTGR